MTLDDLLLTLANFGLALKNHLWQSTVFALGAALLTLALRRNQARTRCWLWMAASIKFLLPFSLLVSLGSYLAPPRPAPAQAGLYSAMEEVSQPFTQNDAFTPSSVLPAASTGRRAADLLPLLVAGVWLGGFLFVVLRLFLRWKQLRGMVSEAIPAREGRVVDMLRRAEGDWPGSVPVELLLSAQPSGREFMALCGRCCCGRRASPGDSMRRILKRFSPMSSAMCGGATTCRPRSTCWWRRSSGSTRWCGGWERGWRRSASEPAMRRCSNLAESRVSMPRAS